MLRGLVIFDLESFNEDCFTSFAMTYFFQNASSVDNSGFVEVNGSQ